MRFIDKIYLLKIDFAYLISIKIGKVVLKNNVCYQVPQWIAWIFYFYYYSGLGFYLIIFITYLNSIFTDILYLRFIYAIFIFIFFILQSNYYQLI